MQPELSISKPDEDEPAVQETFPAADVALRSTAFASNVAPGPSLLCSTQTGLGLVSEEETNQLCQAWLAEAATSLSPIHSEPSIPIDTKQKRSRASFAVSQSACASTHACRLHREHGETAPITVPERSETCAMEEARSHGSVPSTLSSPESLSVRVETSPGVTCGASRGNARSKDVHRGHISAFSLQKNLISSRPVSHGPAATPCGEQHEMQNSQSFNTSCNDSQLESQVGSSLSSDVEDITGAGLHATINCLSLLTAAPHRNKGRWLKGLVRSYTPAQGLSVEVIACQSIGYMHHK